MCYELQTGRGGAKKAKKALDDALLSEKMVRWSHLSPKGGLA